MEAIKFLQNLYESKPNNFSTPQEKFVECFSKIRVETLKGISERLQPIQSALKSRQIEMNRLDTDLELMLETLKRIEDYKEYFNNIDAVRVDLSNIERLMKTFEDNAFNPTSDLLKSSRNKNILENRYKELDVLTNNDFKSDYIVTPLNGIPPVKVSKIQRISQDWDQNGKSVEKISQDWDKNGKAVEEMITDMSMLNANEVDSGAEHWASDSSDIQPTYDGAASSVSSFGDNNDLLGNDVVDCAETKSIDTWSDVPSKKSTIHTFDLTSYPIDKQPLTFGESCNSSVNGESNSVCSWDQPMAKVQKNAPASDASTEEALTVEEKDEPCLTNEKGVIDVWSSNPLGRFDHLPKTRAVPWTLSDPCKVRLVNSDVTEKDLPNLIISSTRQLFIELFPQSPAFVICQTINTPEDFFCYIASKNQSEFRNEFNDAQSKLYKRGVVGFENVKMGMFCAAMWSEDRMFYRAIVTKIEGPSEDPMITVNFIDYGNSEVRKLKHLMPMCLNMATIPTFALHCTLRKDVHHFSTPDVVKKFREIAPKIRRANFYTGYNPNIIKFPHLRCKKTWRVGLLDENDEEIEF